MCFFEPSILRSSFTASYRPDDFRVVGRDLQDIMISCIGQHECAVCHLRDFRWIPDTEAHPGRGLAASRLVVLRMVPLRSEQMIDDLDHGRQLALASSYIFYVAFLINNH